MAKEGPKGPQTEIALVRAADIASGLPEHARHARECYRRLLEDYPYGPWRHIALKRLEELKESAGPEEAQEATGRRSLSDADLRYLGDSAGEEEDAG